MNSWRIRIAAALVMIGCLFPPTIAGQAIPNQVLALYPQNTGELTFINIRELRNSPHYPRLKAQVLPEKFRNLAEWTQFIGIDFDREIDQLSWGFLPGDAQGSIGLVVVAEGRFPARELERDLKQRKLTFEKNDESLLLSLGKNDKGQEFVFAFVDGSTAIFGHRAIAQEMVQRRAQGGQSLLNNPAMLSQITPLNGRAPVWIAMDSQFTLLAVKQLLPGAAELPGFETLAARLQSATLRFDLQDGLRGAAEVRCRDNADAVLVSTLIQAALTYQTWQLNDTNPELSRALRAMTLSRESERVGLGLNIKEPDFISLLNKNSFVLNF